MSKILIIANDFPPPINGGNMRVYKFSKYLVKHGWDVHILCNSSDKVTDIKQHSRLIEELKNVTFHSVPKLFYKRQKLSSNENNATHDHNKKSSFLKRWYCNLSKYVVPDMQRLFWVRPATKEAVKIINTQKIFYVLTSSPPHSTQIIGLKLKKKYGKQIIWIADFRDVWSLSHIYDLNLAKNKKINTLVEREVLQNADKVIFVSDGIRNKTIERFKLEYLSNKSTVIYNGYDSDDFKNLYKIDNLTKDKMHFCYVGTMFGPQTHHKLIEGILHYIERNQNISDHIQFHLVGMFDDIIYKKSNNCKNIIFHSPLEHSVALNFMNTSDVCILILTNDEEGKMAYSGKFFEYLKIGKPILALVPQGEVSEIIEDNNLGVVVSPDDKHAIANAITAIHSQCLNNSWSIANNREFLLNRFDRERLTKKLEQFIMTES